MSSLQEAVEAVRDGSSLYWGFYQPVDRPAESEIVEIRLDATPESVANFAPPSGWSVSRVQWDDTLFLRREQSVDRQAVEQMLVEVLQVADANGMRFHSWLHGPDLD